MNQQDNNNRSNNSRAFEKFEESLFNSLANKQELEAKKRLIPLQVEVSVEELIATLTLTAKKLALLGIFVEINELIDYLRNGIMPGNAKGLLEQIDILIAATSDETTKSVLQLVKLKITGLVLA